MTVAPQGAAERASAWVAAAIGVVAVLVAIAVLALTDDDVDSFSPTAAPGAPAGPGGPAIPGGSSAEGGDLSKETFPVPDGAEAIPKLTDSSPTSWRVDGSVEQYKAFYDQEFAQIGYTWAAKPQRLSGRVIAYAGYVDTPTGDSGFFSIVEAAHDGVPTAVEIQIFL